MNSSTDLMSSPSSSENVIQAQRASSKRSGGESGRAGSLRLTSRPVHIPIPPSLVQSPYLLSPESVFRRVNSASRHLSHEDEEWLQDTIPLSLERRDNAKGTESSANVSSSGEKLNLKSVELSAAAPPTPPLVHWRLQPTSPTGYGNTKSKGLTPAPHDYFGKV